MKKLPAINMEVTVIRTDNILLPESGIYKDFDKKLIQSQRAVVYISGESENIVVCAIKKHHAPDMYITIPAEDLKYPMSYISGPITGIENLNAEAFDECEKELSKLGIVAVNPLKIKNPQAEFMLLNRHLFTEEEIHAEYLKADISTLLDCNEIVLLPGFEKSKGCAIECFIGKMYNKKFRLSGSMEYIEIEPRITEKELQDEGSRNLWNGLILGFLASCVAIATLVSIYNIHH
jgi:hypothetical protein